MHCPSELASDPGKAVSAPSRTEEQLSYAQQVNPVWVRLLDVLDMNVEYTHASGAELFTRDGRVILDCLSGYWVHNTGHNHPYIVAQLVRELEAQSPAMLHAMSL